MVSMPEVISAYFKLRVDADPGKFCLKGRKAEGALSFWNAVLVSNSTERIGNETHSITDYPGLKRPFQ